MQTLIIGPLFTATSTPFNGDDWIVPLGVRLEWAHQHEAAAISLFRHHSRHAPNAVMFWNMVFALPQLPFDVECFAHQVVKTPHGVRRLDGDGPAGYLREPESTHKGATWWC